MTRGKLRGQRRHTLLCDLMQRSGDLFPKTAFQIGIFNAVVDELLAQVVERLGHARDFVCRLDHVLQRAGHSEPRAGK